MTLLCRFVLRPLSTTWVYRLPFSFQRADVTRGTRPTCHEPAHQFGVLVCGFMTRRMCSPRKVSPSKQTCRVGSSLRNPILGGQPFPTQPPACCTHGPCSRLTPPAFLTHACPVPNTRRPCSQHTLGPLPTLVTDSTFIQSPRPQNPQPKPQDPKTSKPQDPKTPKPQNPKTPTPNPQKTRVVRFPYINPYCIP